MAKFELIMPKMGESIMEATILKWLKKEGDHVNQDDTILEVATDKVDSEIPSPTEGIITKILFKENEIVAIGKVIAYIESGDPSPKTVQQSQRVETKETIVKDNLIINKTETILPESALSEDKLSSSERFYSPLVKSIAKNENVSQNQLDKIEGSGLGGRVTKRDILMYLDSLKSQSTSQNKMQLSDEGASTKVSGGVEIIEMDRMRKLIADHMVMSKQTSPHVSCFVEVDMTHAVLWREKVKDQFQKKYNQKITYTPIFVEAVCKAIKDFPMINVSVNGTQIIKKNDINIGMATALPSGNLIVPVIKSADRLNLIGLSAEVNDLAERARLNKLKPEEIQDGTFTITNVGSFGNLTGTPIINQPQVAILAVGTIAKKPAVIETPTGDVIGIRHMMILSLSFDHRVVDGSLGGKFLKRVADYLVGFDINQNV
ncbi:MAG: 2-oxo acid dehydrogenase subunit E2 [Saprospiraceae bacterium]|nr:2-oxo acid dehydrogenase subunit E2 [Saprospiraceae bacterium]